MSKRIKPCIVCKSKDIEIDDCGYSSFNVGCAKCKDCGHEVKLKNCSCFPEKEIITAWNRKNSLRPAYPSSVKKYVSEVLQDEINNAQEVIEENRTIQKTRSKKAEPDKFIVHLDSYWADYGERAIVHEGNSLKSAIKDAEREFMRANNRSDVQARYTVYAVFEKKQIPLPNKYWGKYKQEE